MKRRAFYYYFMQEQERMVDFPVFNYKILLVYTDDIVASRKSRCDLVGAMDSEINSFVDGLHSYNEIEPNGIVFFTAKTSLGTISHECFHAVYRMFKWIGAKIENEITAYHLGYLVDEAIALKNIPLETE